MPLSSRRPVEILEIPAEGKSVPRKPNYKFERFERDRAKAEKKAARLQAKAERRAAKSGDEREAETDETAGAPEDTEGSGPRTD
jgi:hypothetical protein